MAVTMLALALLAIATTPASAQLTLDLLHEFAGSPDGDLPQGGVIQDADGNLYGTTALGGVNCFDVIEIGCGTVYKIDAHGGYTVLYRFLGGNDGAAPRAGLARDAAGNLYGTTQGQGTPSTVFKVDPSGNETVLHILNSPANAAPVLDAVGNLFGTVPISIGGYGTIYTIGVHGGFGMLHTFSDPADGAAPSGGLVIDARGNLYGATLNGGIALERRSCFTDAIGIGGGEGCGTIFRVTPKGDFTVLYRFHGTTDGGNPVSVVLDPAGNLYGVTDSGGDFNCLAPVNLFGCGTIFKIDTKGKFSVLHTFEPNPPQESMFNNLFLDSKGNLYGTNQVLPYSQAGTLFELDTAGNYTVLYTFSSLTDGVGVDGTMIAPNGDFYGTLGEGGSLACRSMDPPFGLPCGTVFKLTPSSSPGDSRLSASFTPR
jgi:uncharacterized repeat protein (TIGR03803 family)